MSYGEPLTTTIPAVGAAGTQYATDINARLAEMETILESKVPYSALTGSELDLNNVPIRDCTYLELYELASAPATSPVGRLCRYQNNLYWVTDEGAVRITLDGALDASSVAGIGGDYGGANPALVSFTDSTSVYNFYDDGGTSTWGYVRSRGIDIADGAATTDFVKLRAPAIAASYTLTLPAALPAGNRSVLTVNSSGSIEPNDGTNLITNPVYVATGTDIILQGTAKIQHGSRTRTVGIVPGFVTGTTVVAFGSALGAQATTAGNGTMYQAIDTTVGERILSFVARLSKNGTTQTDIQLIRYVPSTGVQMSLGTGSSTTNGNTTISHTLASPETMGTDEVLFVVWNPGDNSEEFMSIEITYDFPA